MNSDWVHLGVFRNLSLTLLSTKQVDRSIVRIIPPLLVLLMKNEKLVGVLG